EGELKTRASRKVELHVRRCRRCNDDLRELQTLRLLLRNSSQPLPSPALWRRTFLAIRNLNRRSKILTRQSGIHTGLATVCCVVILTYLLMVPSEVNNTPPPSPTFDPATLVSMHADLRSDLPLADSGAMRY